ncbi:YhgE/Pip domain-containing protein, partial [Clostridium saudiense]|nr:YhgE/Pip domain-containing protein [Clostridium saudiense]
IYNSLVKIQGSFGDINNTVDTAADGAEKIQTLITDIQNDIPKIQETITNAQNLSSQVQNFINSSQGAVEKLAPTIKQDIKIVSEVSRDIATYTQGVKDAINSGADNAPAMVNNLITKVNGLKSTADSVLNILKALNKISGGSLSGAIDNLTNISNSLSTALGTLNDIKAKVDSGVVIDLSLLDNIIGVANNVASISDGIYSNYDSTIMPALNDTLNVAYNTASGALDILKGAEATLPQVQDILNIAYSGAQKGEEGIAFVKEALPEAEAMINDLVTKMANVSNEDELKEIVNLLKADVAKRSDFLANPVNIVENKLYPMGNYGTAMTPFYTVLSLWVGLMLLSSMISVEKEGEYTPRQVYFGKLLLYLTIAIIQAVIVALGDLYILKIYCVNPALFVAGIVFTAVTFTFIVYSLVSVFGNVGKVLGIILLVLQVAGSGGTFPIQLTPRFFQVVNPFLPFTYSISFAREAIGGVVQSVLTKDIIISLVYIVASLLVALLLKKAINKLSEGFVQNFKKSGLGE